VFEAYVESTKIHMLADALGRPLRLVISAGRVHDCTQADHLLEDIKTTHMIADKGYNSKRILEKIKDLSASPIIPPKFNRKVQREYDQELYKMRNRIDRTSLPPFSVPGAMRV
jgi:transposase